MLFHRTSLLGVGLVTLAAGCQSARSTAISTRPDPGTSAAVAAPQSEGQADPPEISGNSYRAQLYAEAIRGLKYENETVTIDLAVADSIAQRGTREAAQAALNEGRTALDLNDQHAALRAFTRAVIIDPTLAEAYKLLGVAHSQRGKEPAALASFRKAVELTPDDVAARMKLAWSLGRLSRWAEEIDAWRDVVAIDPAQGEAHGRLAIALYMNEDLPGALDEIRAAQALGYEFPAQFLAQVARSSEQR
jgi:Flp pilus assembly protein TadD